MIGTSVSRKRNDLESIIKNQRSEIKSLKRQLKRANKSNGRYGISSDNELSFDDYNGLQPQEQEEINCPSCKETVKVTMFENRILLVCHSCNWSGSRPNRGQKSK